MPNYIGTGKINLETFASSASEAARIVAMRKAARSPLAWS